MCHYQCTKLDLKCGFMGKMIPLTPFIWNNIWVKWTVQCNSGLQNNVFSGLPLQDIFLLNTLHLLNFFLNILKSASLYIPVKCTERERTRPINRSSVSSLIIIITKKGFFSDIHFVKRNSEQINKTENWNGSFFNTVDIPMHLAAQWKRNALYMSFY